MGSRRWTQAEIDYLRKVYPHRSNADIAVFLHRPARGIGEKARSLGVYKSPEFAEQQRKVIDLISTEIAKVMPTQKGRRMF